MKPLQITTTETEALLGVSRVQVSRLAKAGQIVRASRGRYDAASTAHAFIGRLYGSFMGRKVAHPQSVQYQKLDVHRATFREMLADITADREPPPTDQELDAAADAWRDELHTAFLARYRSSPW